MKSFALLCGVAMALAMAACHTGPSQFAQIESYDDNVKAITGEEAQWNRDWAAKSVERILSHYVDEAVLAAPGGEPLKGKDAIKGALAGIVSDKALSLTHKASKVDVSKSGDLAYVEGEYQLTFTDPTTQKVIHDHGVYVTTYRQQSDGSWKVVVNIATSVVPPAPPKPEG
jgi:uncharacterized protein (TIGR02246 family)